MYKYIPSLIVVFFFLVPKTYAQYDSPDDARNYLLQGVKKVSCSGVPGPFILTKESAFPVLVGSMGGDTQVAAIAAGYMGEGAVLTFGHGSYFTPNGFQSDDTGKLIENGLRWAAGKENPKVLNCRNEKLTQYLLGQGFQVTQNKGTALTANHLANFDVLIFEPYRQSQSEIANVKEFIQGGKGLLASGLAWGWSQLNPGKSIKSDMKANILLADAGIVWANGYMSNNYAEIQHEISPYLNAGKAMEYIKSHPLASADRKSYAQALSTFMKTLPYLSGISPFAIENKFPGKVSGSANRVSKTISINTKIPRWHSTGLYAAPGEEITVNISESNAKNGYGIRIGAHTDQNYKLDKWTRHPEISALVPIEKPTTKAFNPFGGLIYIEVPEKQTVGNIDITISGGIEAPHFVLGETDINEWKRTIRKHPAPWAELEGKELIITLQSDKIRNYDNPDEIIRFWDKVQVNNRKLASWQEGVNRPMRIVFDIQIALGYMHSGYPVMSLITDYGEQEAILAKQDDHWGFYHELGHNHQHPDWTFEGTGEVTCNLFTLYNIVYAQGKNRLIGKDQDSQKHMVNEYFNSGSPFEKWKSEPFLALHMYDQLIEVYGWPVLESIFKKYTELQKEKRPKNNQDKMDFWFTLYCNTVGKNLTNFFDKWGMPITVQAKQQVSHLPEANLNKLLANMAIEEIPKPKGIIERFRYDNGFFVKRKSGNRLVWAEQRKDGSDAFLFEEFQEDENYFYMTKNGTTMDLRIPKKRGWTQWQMQGQSTWNNLCVTNPF